MPHRPATPCKHPGCARLVPYGTKYCDEHKRMHTKDRKGASARGYNSRWVVARKRYLESHPLCVECQKEGRITIATVVDHIIPHRGDHELFWDESNWQALCEHHHNVKTMTKDRYQEYKY